MTKKEEENIQKMWAHISRIEDIVRHVKEKHIRKMLKKKVNRNA